MSDVMLHCVLKMPPNLWSDCPFDISQRHGHYVEASKRIEELERQLADARELLIKCLSIMPVGYIPTHTEENLPEMIGDLAKALAEETTEREKLEHELSEMHERCEKLQKERDILVRAFNSK